MGYICPDKTFSATSTYFDGLRELGNRRAGIEVSKNAVKYYQKLRKKHLYIANVREDFLQKTTTLLAKTYQHILVEDLNVFRLDG